MGFNFSKISIKKLNNIDFENLKINTNIDIPDINKLDSDLLKTKDEILDIKFNYIIDYEPNFVKIELSGNIILSIDLKTTKEILKKWEDKQMSEDFKIGLFNLILRKANIKAIQLEDELNIPLHIRLPTLKKQEIQKEKSEEKQE